MTQRIPQDKPSKKPQSSIQTNGNRRGGNIQTATPPGTSAQEMALPKPAAIQRSPDAEPIAKPAEASELVADLDRVIRTYPLCAVLLAVGFGFLLAQLTRR